MTFHSLIWLYAGLIVAIALIALAFYSRAKRRDMLSKFASQRLMPELTRTVSRPKIIAKNTLAFLSVMLIFAALARPQWGYRWEETKTRGIDIIFAIDTSNSMLAEDVKPDRLERAKLSVLDLVNILQGDKIGIVAFSGQAFLQCPLTLDYDAFRMSLEALDTNVIQRGGTNISAAIEEAEVAFASTSNRKIIVLISDGEELEDSALNAAKKAAENGVVIYTLGVGGANGEFIPVRDASGGTTLLKDESGNPVKSRLNEKTLTEIAKATGGFYEPLTADGMDIIYNEGLKKIPTQEMSSRMKQLAIERFQIPLGLAILLLALSSLTGTRKFFVGRGGAAAVLFLSLALLPAPKSFAQDKQQAPQEAAAAAPIAADAAEKLIPQTDAPAEKPQEKKYSIPENPDSRDMFNLGIDAKNAGDFDKAREFFLAAAKLSPEDFALHSDIYYNIGNMDYAAAKSASSKMLAPQNVAKNTAAVFAQSEQSASLGTQTLGEGLKLLEEESKALKSAKDENEKKQALEKSPLKQNGFQEKLKQAISACEASSKAAEETSASIGKAVSQWADLSKMIDKPVSEYSDALLLNPSNKDAAENLKAAESAKSAAAKEMDKLSKISANSVPELQKIKQDLGKLVEELKKLLRDDNQNQQNQQNQNNQNNQNNQDQQNQQNQQNQNNQQNQQNQNQQNQNNQQNQQDQNKQNQSNQDKQNNQEQQNKDNQNQQKDKQENRQDKQNEKDKGNQNNADKNKDENSQPNDNKNGGEDRQNPENKKDEQAIDNSQKPGGEDKKPESAQGGDKRDELPAPKKDEPAGAAGEIDKENVRESEGAMTRAEARQLLDSMKDDEKFLPLRGFGTQKQRYESSYKDW